jgi:hypothetical protein
MSAFRKKPVVIEATQWFKNGDHPEDRWTPGGVGPEGFEGRVVRYFRRPDISGALPCSHCKQAMHVHGWIDTLEGGHTVCPGDFIITGVKGERYPCKPDIFALTYEPASSGAAVEVSDAPMEVDASDVDGEELMERFFRAIGLPNAMVEQTVDDGGSYTILVGVKELDDAAMHYWNHGTLRTKPAGQPYGSVQLPVDLGYCHGVLDELGVPHGKSSLEAAPMTLEGRLRWLTVNRADVFPAAAPSSEVAK